ncbi:enoyl-CoA hydratase [Corynebacterium auriscanis]|uniref:enoyl-CoA hydratase n=1 Tax=Corynebacterium auriscanis TaxID=99807 RepID=UPI003CEBC012
MNEPYPVETVLVEQRGVVTIITLNRPEARNALREQECVAVAQAVRAASQTGGEGEMAGVCRAILLRGEGSVFCAGADLKGAVYGSSFGATITQMLQAIVDCSLPVIADIQGPAVGAGCQLALACDLRIFGDDAQIWIPAADHGLALDSWTHLRAKELLGGAVARNVFLGSGVVGPEQALMLGFAIKRTDGEGALQFAQEVATKAPLTLAYSKAVLNHPAPEGDAGLKEMFDRVWASDDVQEARRARAEKRAPRFRGR